MTRPLTNDDLATILDTRKEIHFGSPEWLALRALVAEVRASRKVAPSPRYVIATDDGQVREIVPAPAGSPPNVFGYVGDAVKVAPSPPAPVEDARPMLTEWRNCGDGVFRERVRVDGGRGGVRASVWEFYITTPDGERIEGERIVGSSGETRGDAAARQWYRLPDDAPAAPDAPASDEPSVPDFLAAARESRARLKAAGISLRDHDEPAPMGNPLRVQDGCDGEHHTFNAGGAAYLVACPKCFTLARLDATRAEPKAPTGEE